MGEYLDVEDLDVYRKLCALHLEVCRLGRDWPREETYELTSQVRRSSNSAPANLAEKNSDRHLRNKIEGINRARGEAEETIHGLRIALLKGYVPQDEFDDMRAKYQECIRMLNGLERSLERHLPQADRRFPDRSASNEPEMPSPEHRTLNTEH